MVKPIARCSKSAMGQPLCAYQLAALSCCCKGKQVCPPMPRKPQILTTSAPSVVYCGAIDPWMLLRSSCGICGVPNRRLGLWFRAGLRSEQQQHECAHECLRSPGHRASARNIRRPAGTSTPSLCGQAKTRRVWPMLRPFLLISENASTADDALINCFQIATPVLTMEAMKPLSCTRRPYHWLLSLNTVVPIWLVYLIRPLQKAGISVASAISSPCVGQVFSVWAGP